MQPFPRVRGPRRWVLDHPRLTMAGAGVVVIAAAGVILGSITVRNQERVEVIEGRLREMERIQSLHTRLQRSLLDDYRGAVPASSYLVGELRLQVEQALSLGDYLDSQTAEGLRQLRVLLGSSPVVPRTTLFAALDLVAGISKAEAEAQGDLLDRIHRDTGRELRLTAAALLTLAGLVLVGAWVVPRRLLHPLRGLGELLTLLSEGQFRRVSTEDVDPLLIPLFENFNHLVDRLEELEEEHRLRADSLKSEVRAAAEALLDQHRTLANAERLAAVGETAAGVAHELRNPLAGALMSLSNLRDEVVDPEVADRVGLLSSELERVVRLLNGYLSAARHAPEPPRPTRMADLVGDLLTLLRYQAPAHVRLEEDVPDDLECTLPRDRIRQALLNLVMNSMQALGEEAGSVTVSARREGDDLVLTVSDDGPGFPTEFVTGGVQPFSTVREGGTGLGLAMVRRVVHDFGGTVRIANAEEGGARVRLAIPCSWRSPGTAEGP